MSKEQNGNRLREILAVVRKHGIARGVSPEKIRLILEDLGPTYIKLGQILSVRSDILPKSICDELIHLQSDVTPMPFSEVREVIQESYGIKLEEAFCEFSETPIGSASIAQVHKARLHTGEAVVVKVQRQGIYETMSKDMDFLHKCIRLAPTINMNGMVDLPHLLDEMWMVAQDEMNFLTEASNMEAFAKLNRDVNFVYVPKLYREFTTRHVLVMEYIDGIPIDDLEQLKSNGYDLNEIGTKIADNYVKQISEDGFFHADPHPGNVFIRGGKIVWLDMGMMGHFTQREQLHLTEAIKGVANRDVSDVVEAVLALGEFHDRPNQKLLYSDVSDWLAKYGSADFGKMNIGAVLQDLMDIMKENKVSMPPCLSMLVRGLTTIEGLLSRISPEISLMDVAGARVSGTSWKNLDLKKLVNENGRELFLTLRKTLKIPGYVSDLLHSYSYGQTRVNLDLHAADDLSELLQSITRHIVLGLLIAALLISSSIICMTNMSPKILEIPLLGAVGYLLAFVLTLIIFVQFLLRRRKKRKYRRRRKKFL